MVAMTTDGAEPLALTSSHGGSGARTHNRPDVYDQYVRVSRYAVVLPPVESKRNLIAFRTQLIGTATCFEFYHSYSHFVAYRLHLRQTPVREVELLSLLCQTDLGN